MSVEPPLIRLSGVHAGYRDRRVLAGVDLTLSAGERLALLGANGAGKSTLLNVITGFVPVAKGEVVAFGAARRTEKDFREVRVRAGFVFQDPDDQLFCPTVIEDVAFGPLNLGQTREEARATAAATLASVGLSGFENRVTHRLSGGEKRLVTIASVLAMRPDVLLLDEPTSGLDGDAYARLCNILLALPQAMIIVAHDATFVARLATSAVLVEGGICRRGTIHSHAHAHTHAHPHLHFDEDDDHEHTS
jgi:cobalt/nickel transport system ATP-binding protein